MAISFNQLKKKAQKLHQDLVDYSGLPHDVVDNIVTYTRCLTKEETPDEIDEVIFAAQMLKQFNLTSPVMITNMFRAIKSSKAQSATVEQFCRLICIYVSNNTEKLTDFVFDVYDFNQDGVISYHELYYYLKPCVLSFDDEMDITEAVKELIDHVLKITDTDENGSIDRHEFKALIKKNVVYIQLLGPCIPSGQKFETFRHKMMTLCHNDVRKVFADERFSSLQSVKYNVSSSLYPVVLELP